MEFTVQYVRFFEEFGWNDCDVEKYDSLDKAWARFNELKASHDDIKLFANGELIHY